MSMRVDSLTGIQDLQFNTDSELLIKALVLVRGEWLSQSQILFFVRGGNRIQAASSDHYANYYTMAFPNKYGSSSLPPNWQHKYKPYNVVQTLAIV